MSINAVHDFLRAMLSMSASDLFLSSGFPPSVKRHGEMIPVLGYENQVLTGEDTRMYAHAIMNEARFKEFESQLESNFAINPEGIGRFRVNAFIQQQRIGMVLRTITTDIPDFDKMNLPSVLKSMVLEKRGLILLVGGTGSGKSTTMAAMIGQRNKLTKGHIITIEDPVEYVHEPIQCLVTQREVGVDTLSWHDALKNTLRQAPDLILIGEIRDQETMEHALAFAETGHLCMATLHANNANQAIDRILNFFPHERRDQLLMDLSLNIKGLVSQRLIPKSAGGRVAAIEILLGTGTVQDAILKGEIERIKEIMAASRKLGMQTFDQALFDLYENGEIEYLQALKNADKENDLRLKIKLESKRSAEEKGSSSGASLSLA